RIERFGADGPRFEALRVRVAPDLRLTVAASHHRLARQDDAFDRSAVLRHHCHGLPGADRGWWIDHSELHDAGLLLQRAAEALKRKLQGRPVTRDGGGVLDLGRVDLVEHEGFYP